MTVHPGYESWGRDMTPYEAAQSALLRSTRPYGAPEDEAHSKFVRSLIQIMASMDGPKFDAERAAARESWAAQLAKDKMELGIA